VLLPDDLNVQKRDVTVCVHVTAEVLPNGLLSFVRLRLIRIQGIDDPIAVDVAQEQAQADRGRV
jgi:hypothetical protein